MFITLLGTQLHESGKFYDNLELHMRNRYLAVHKFYNFLRANKLAPIPVKLKVLRACVMSAMLHNCETFGKCSLKKLESLYFTLIKQCLGVRASTPNKLVLIESGMPSLQTLILTRQFKIFKTFITELAENSPRKIVYESLLQNRNPYLQYYCKLTQDNQNTEEIKIQEKDKLLAEVTNFAENNKYKFQIYKNFNPNLKTPDLMKPYAVEF